MMEQLITSELISNVARRTGVPIAMCRAVYNAHVDAIKAAIREGREVVLRNYISIKPTVLPVRRYRNPQTGEMGRLPERKTIKVRVSREIKNLMNRRKEVTQNEQE